MSYKRILRRFALAVVTCTIAISGNAYARSTAEVMTQSKFLHRAAMNEATLSTSNDIVRSLIQTDAEAMTIRKKVKMHARTMQIMNKKKNTTTVTTSPYAVEGKPLTDTQKIRLITRRSNGTGPCASLHTHARAECYKAMQMKKAFAFRRALVQK
jgi:LytS/YehU family sensor histidine kinase